MMSPTAVPIIRRLRFSLSSGYNIVEELVQLVGAQNIEGIVLSGGCALNVLMNQLI